MNKQYFNLSIVLFCAWNVYSRCQQESTLPLIAGGIVVAAYLLRLRSPQKQYIIFDKLPLSMVIILSILTGYLWRNIYPVPEEAVSPYPTITAALQSATIFAGILLWLKPCSKANVYRLTFLAWLCVALSVNVPFDQSKLFHFCSFCIVATAAIILFAIKKPLNKKYLFRYYRDYILYSVLLVTMTVALFYGISKAILITDKIFMHWVSDYVKPHLYTHFLRIDSRLNIVPPGKSGIDKRPVFEIRVPGRDWLYLKTQVFDEFNNGTWSEDEHTNPQPLPRRLIKGHPTGTITMFTTFDTIIPSPSTITAGEGNAVYSRDDNNIVYSDDEQDARIIRFSILPVRPPVNFTRQMYKQYTQVPAEIAADLKEISASIMNSDADLRTNIYLLRDFFKNNFEYSLTSNFRADNEGIIRMIKERRPAYCSYFASALVLLLRSQNIPARMATGFFTAEKVDTKNNTFLARVKNAHAWTEVLVTDQDPETGTIRSQWMLVDPTPSGAAIYKPEKKHLINIDKISENLWLALLRLRTQIANINQEKMKVYLLYALIITLMVINRNNLWGYITALLKRSKKKKPVTIKAPDELFSVYAQYEIFLKDQFNEKRKSSETDLEVVARLKTKDDIDEKILQEITSFLNDYQAARFGFKKKAGLKAKIQNLGQNPFRG